MRRRELARVIGKERLKADDDDDLLDLGGGREKRLEDLETGRILNLIGSMGSGLEEWRLRACDRRIKYNRWGFHKIKPNSNFQKSNTNMRIRKL